MQKLTFRLKNGSILTVEDKPFAKGGEGDLYRIIEPRAFQSKVLKVYKPEKQNQVRENKIDFLVRNPPRFQAQNGHFPVIWPSNTVYFSDNRFAGFLMPLAKGEKLETLCHSQLPKNLGSDWQKFDRSNPNALQLRLKLCFNISVALYQINSLRNYVLVDMKPENIMVQANGLISIIDIDSIEILQGGKVLYPAEVATPDYTPPEYYFGVKPGKSAIRETWDHFSMAVIFYRILCGIHPFSGTCNPPHHQINTHDALIQHGLFPHIRNGYHFRVVPPPHHTFKNLNQQVQDLFVRCFDKGHSVPDYRPSAEEWCSILSPEPVIKLDRILPSGRFSPVSNESYSKLQLNFFTLPLLPPIPDFQFPRQSWWSKLISSIFGKPAKLKLVAEINTQVKILQNIQDQVHLEHEKRNRLKYEFDNEQLKLIQKRQPALQIITSWYRTEIDKIDKQAQQYFGEEINLLRALESKFHATSAEIDNRINAYHAVQVVPVEQKYQSILANLNRQLVELDEQERREIAKSEESLRSILISIKNEIRQLAAKHFEPQNEELNRQLADIQRKRSELKQIEQNDIIRALEIYQAECLSNHLAQFHIAPDAFHIFRDQYADASVITRMLEIAGITTAADFTNCDAIGRLLKKNDNWVKVREVGQYRAESLISWRQRIIRNHPFSPPQSLPQYKIDIVRQSFANRFAELDLEERNARTSAQMKRAQSPNWLAEQKSQLTQRQTKVISDADNQKQLISARYQLQRNQLHNKIKSSQQEFQSIITPVRQKFEKEKSLLLQERNQVWKRADQQKRDVRAKYDGTHNPLNSNAKDILTVFQQKQETHRKETNELLIALQVKLQGRIQQDKLLWEAIYREYRETLKSMKELHLEFEQIKRYK